MKDKGQRVMDDGWGEGVPAFLNFIFHLVGLEEGCISKFSFLGWLQVPFFGGVVVIVVIVIVIVTG